MKHLSEILSTFPRFLLSGRFARAFILEIRHKIKEGKFFTGGGRGLGPQMEYHPTKKNWDAVG